VTVTDNAAAPVDSHPKFPKKSALEVNMCTLHSGGQVRLQGIRDVWRPARRGVSVANALSERLEVEVARRADSPPHGVERGQRRASSRSSAVRPTGAAQDPLPPDPQIFGAKAQFKPERVFKMTRSKPICSAASRSAGRVPRSCSPASRTCPRRPLSISPTASRTISPPHHGSTSSPRHLRRQRRQDRGTWRGAMGVAWTADADGFLSSYCNTIRRRTAAPTNPACAARCSRASRITPSGSDRASVPPRSR